MLCFQYISNMVSGTIWSSCTQDWQCQRHHHRSHQKSTTWWRDKEWTNSIIRGSPLQDLQGVGQRTYCSQHQRLRSIICRENSWRWDPTPPRGNRVYSRDPFSERTSKGSWSTFQVPSHQCKSRNPCSMPHHWQCTGWKILRYKKAAWKANWTEGKEFWKDKIRGRQEKCLWQANISHWR